MQVQAQLVHAEPGRFVVQVSGWSGDQCLGSALGEAENAEAAEDRALARLQDRLASAPPPQPVSPAPSQAHGPTTRPVPAAAPHQPLNQGAGQAPIRGPVALARESPGPSPGRVAPKEPSLPGPQAKPVRPQNQASPFPAALATKPAPGAAGREGSQRATVSPGSLPTSADPTTSPPDAGDPGTADQPTNGPGQFSLGEASPNAVATPTPAPVSIAPAPAGPGASSEQPADPEDWSDELAALDIQLQRLGWQRDQEATYLQRAFGHPSRSRLTSYGDLVAYLTAVRQLQAPADPASVPVPLRRMDLLAQSDDLLAQLGWDATRGREVLETFFQCSSRQQLSDENLLRFNMVLEGELIAEMGGPIPKTGL